MAHSIDLLVLIAFFLIQARITAMLLRSAARRWTGARLTVARTAIAVFDLLLLAGYLLSFSELLSWLRVPSRIGAYLAAFALVYLMIATAAVVVRATLHGVFRRYPATAEPGRRELLRAAGNLAIAAPAAVLGYGTFVERFDLHVHELDVPLAGLSPDLDGVRILQISDIHRGAFLSDRELGKVIDASLGLHPHVAVITGDLISTWGDPLDSCIRQLARVKADAGVFGCMGNHERYADALDHTERAAARVGIRFLRGAAQSLRFGGAALNLAGVDYQSKSERPRYLQGAERLIQPGASCSPTIPMCSQWRPGRAIICCLRVIRMADRSSSKFSTRRSTPRASSRRMCTASIGPAPRRRTSRAESGPSGCPHASGRLPKSRSCGSERRNHPSCAI